VIVLHKSGAFGDHPVVGLGAWLHTALEANGLATGASVDLTVGGLLTRLVEIGFPWDHGAESSSDEQTGGKKALHVDERTK